MRIKAYIIIISAGIMVFLPNFSLVLALDEWKNKFEIEKTINLPEGKRAIEVVASHEEVYDFDSDKWSCYKYALELGTSLTEHFGFAVEYKYIDKKDKKDGEEIEGNLSFCCELPLKIELKDENKLVTDIRGGNYTYENEIELCREIAKFAEGRAMSLLLGDVLIYDFQEDKWTENEVNGGIEVVCSRSWKLEIKYCYIDKLDSPDDSEKMETKLTFSF